MSLTKRPAVAVIIAAAGNSTRMGDGIDKQFVCIGGKAVLWHVVSAFVEVPEVKQFIVTASPYNREQIETLLHRVANHIPWQVVLGGAERQQSVLYALRQVDPSIEFVLVHDGARPFIDRNFIENSIEAAQLHGASTMAVPAKDTIKISDRDECVAQTLDRSMLWQIQTPQAFRRELLLKAHEKAAAEGKLVTDDAALIEWIGGTVKLVRGSYFNIKVTTPEDLIIAEAVAAKRGIEFMQRVGIGYDVHRFIGGRPLMLGGVEISHPEGLEGHSDADVLLHAIADALLGAAGLGDIGRHFPDSDPQYKGISSLILLAEVRSKLEAAGFATCNVDAVVQAEAPRLAPYISRMNEMIAATLKVESNKVNVKATTTEKLGFVGRREGIAAEAVVLIGPYRS